MDGFLSKHKPQFKKIQRPFGNLKLRKKANFNECTENPPLRRSSFLTDDEDSGPEIEKICKEKSINSTNINDKSINMPTVIEQNKENEHIPDTVIDTVCTKLSAIGVKSPLNKQVSESLFNETQKSVPETVVGTPSESRALQEIEMPLSSKKKLFFDEDIPQDIDETVADEVLEILDSSDESEINRMEPPQLKPDDSFMNCSSSAGTINDFFNNPPSLSSNDGITHSMIQRFKNGEQLLAQQGEKGDEIMETSDMYVTFRKSQKSFNRTQSFLEHVEIGPTDESDQEENDANIVDLTLDDSLSNTRQPVIEPRIEINATKSNKEKQTPVSISVSTQTPTDSSTKKKKNLKNINIKLDLKIRIRGISSSPSSRGDGSDNDSSADEVEISSRTNMRALPQSPFIESKFSDSNYSAETTQETVKETTGSKMIESDLKTPSKEPKLVIDGELQSMLTELYGNAWKTPEVRSSYKITKTQKRVELTRSEKSFRPKPADSNLLRVVHSNTVIKKTETVKTTASRRILLTPELPIECDKENDKSGSAICVEKTPEKCKAVAPEAVKRTPLHLLCDPDTQSDISDDDSSDEDFKLDDTWNASSDEEYVSEKDRIKKRQSIKYVVPKDEMVFTLDDSLDDVLKKYEFHPQPQIATSESPEIPRRRKLFNPIDDYDDDEKSENFEVPKVIDKKSTPATPKPAIKPPVKPKTPSSVLKSTPSSNYISNKSLSSKEIAKKFSKYSFLKSLDAESNKMLCDPEAVAFRENFKKRKLELTEKLFKMFNEKVFDLKLTSVPVKWNKKLLTTGGRCNNSRRQNIRSSMIELSDKVLSSADRLRCTLIHEMCHAAAWILNGENGHGAVWKKWTGIANSVFPELPKITVCHDYIIEYKYTYLCVNCKARSQAHSKNKKIEEIRCSLCKGDIQLFMNKKDKDGKLELVPVQKKEPNAFAKFVQLKFKEVKTPYKSHKEVMQQLSAQFSNLSVYEKAQLLSLT